MKKEAQGGGILTPRWRRSTSASETDTPDTAGSVPARACPGAVKILGEIADDPQVGFCGTMGIITTLEFFQHLLA
jgi:hypothetical protein